MTDKDFFDALLGAWKETTRAGDCYWEPKQLGDTWSVYAVGRGGDSELVAVGLSEADAEFITGLHGCLPDVVRRLHAAVDEADRLDAERDEREQLIAELARKANG